MERNRPRNIVVQSSLLVLAWIFWVMFMFFEVNDEDSGTKYELLMSIGFALGLLALALSIVFAFEFPESAVIILGSGFAVYLLVGALFHSIIKRKFGSLYRCN